MDGRDLHFVEAEDLSESKDAMLWRLIGDQARSVSNVFRLHDLESLQEKSDQESAALGCQHVHPIQKRRHERQRKQLDALLNYIRDINAIEQEELPGPKAGSVLT